MCRDDRGVGILGPENVADWTKIFKMLVEDHTKRRVRIFVHVVGRIEMKDPIACKLRVWF